jgi:hypothetical protein
MVLALNIIKCCHGLTFCIGLLLKNLPSCFYDTEALLEAYPEAASLTNNYGNLALHFTAWKKGPLDVERLLLKVYPEGAAQKNNHGNLPLHYAAHYNAPLEVVEALYNAYPEGAVQKNNDNNTPLDLAIADGASPNVVALLQGKSVPPTDDEVLESAQRRCEAMEKEYSRYMEHNMGTNEELETVLALLLDIQENHPHALYSAGINPQIGGTMDAIMDQVCHQCRYHLLFEFPKIVLIASMCQMAFLNFRFEKQPLPTIPFPPVARITLWHAMRMRKRPSSLKMLCVRLTILSN